METNPNANVPPKAVKATRATLSRKHADLLDQAKVVRNTWLKHTDYTLLWLSCADFGTSITKAETTFSSRVSGAGDRKTITAKLNLKDKEIDNSISTLKSYLTSKYRGESAGRPYYGKFAITWNFGTHSLSKERSERLEGLKQIKSAIVSEGFSDMELGLSYWTNMYNTYKKLFDDANALDSQVTEDVGDKNEQAAHIRKVLSSLMFLIRSQNPDTYENEWRTWGFRKDRL